MKSERKAPTCYNFLSILKRNSSNLKEAVRISESAGYGLCSLAIEPDGSIRLGESVECLRIGNVLVDDIYTAYNKCKNINSSSCNNCGLMNKLPIHYRVAIDIV